MQIEPSQSGRKPYLDGLRGIAACMVFFDHLTLALAPAAISFERSQTHDLAEMRIGTLPIAWLWNGSFAVCIFFILSGYVLSEFSARTRIGLTAQMVRRYVRLALPMLLTSTLAFALMALGLYKNLDASTLLTKSDWLAMWYRAFEPDLFGMAKESLVDAFVSGRSSYNPNLWTMQIELIGSSAVFFTFLFKSSLKRLLLAIVLLIVGARSYYSLFAIGMIYFQTEGPLMALFESGRRNKRMIQWIASALLLAGLYFGSYPNAPPELQPAWYSFLPRTIPVTGWHMIGASLAVYAVLFSATAQRLLGGPFGRYLGRLSFVLYLVHLPVICSVTSWCVLVLSGLSYGLDALLSSILSITATFAISTLLYRYVDVFSTRFSQQIGFWVDDRVAGIRLNRGFEKLPAGAKRPV